jgi:hypothetical protein
MTTWAVVSERSRPKADGPATASKLRLYKLLRGDPRDSPNVFFGKVAEFVSSRGTCRPTLLRSELAIFGDG